MQLRRAPSPSSRGLLLREFVLALRHRPRCCTSPTRDRALAKLRMDPPSARPASPLPPLERLAPATAEQSYPPSSPPAPIRSAADYNSDSDDELVYATPATSSKPRTRGHQPRPSTSRLLTDEPDAAKRIAAETEYSLGADGRLEEDGLESRTGAWGVLDSSKIFLRRNEGASSWGWRLRGS